LNARYVQAADEKEKAKMEAEIHRLVVSRDRKYTSFIEFNHYKLVYRRYAGLFFTIAVDVNDNELVRRCLYLAMLSTSRLQELLILLNFLLPLLVRRT
jgi:hypothetical protein